jgi:hypothetical protein
MGAQLRNGARALWRSLFVLLFLVLLVPVHLGAGSQSASARQTTVQVPSTKTVNLQLVFDASGSMAECLGVDSIFLSA